MPELPEVEIVARRATTALAGRPIARVAVVGVNALRSLDPPPGVLDGTTLTRVLRRGKLLLLDTDGDHLLLIHLMTGGALRWKGESTPRDRALRLVVTFDDDGPVLRLRERGTRQAAWVRAVARADLEAGTIPELAQLGPEAWWPVGSDAAVGDGAAIPGEDDGLGASRRTGALLPSAVPADPIAAQRQLAAALGQPRPLHSLLRDQRVLAGIGRTWSDEIVWAAQRSPYQRGTDLSVEERLALAGTIHGVLGAAIDAYEAKVGSDPAEKLAKPVQVHGRVGEPCPRCGTTLRGVFFESHTIAYCPKEQTGGRVLKDRRLSRLGIEDALDED